MARKRFRAALVDDRGHEVCLVIGIDRASAVGVRYGIMVIIRKEILIRKYLLSNNNVTNRS